MAQTNINKRLKSHFNHLELYLKPMKKQYDNNGNISFHDNTHRLFVSFNIKLDQEQELAVEDQRMIISLEEIRGNTFTTKAFNIEESKVLLNDLLLELSNVYGLVRDEETASSVALPKIKNMLFDVSFEDEDFDKFIETINPLIQKHKDKVGRYNAQEKELKDAEEKYQADLSKLTNQPQIDKLRNQLEELERAEGNLKIELHNKHNLTHLSNVLEGKQNTRWKSIQFVLKEAAKIVKTKKLNINFSRLEEILTKNKEV